MESLILIIFLIAGFIFTFISLAFSWVVGTIVEKNHYNSIINREKIYITLPAVTLKKVDLDESQIKEAKLVYGSAVIGIDNFKKFLAGLINIFGGKVISHESLLDRARREAILRMKQMAANSDLIINMRLETSSIGQSHRNSKKDNVACVEVLAYGTAITYK